MNYFVKVPDNSEGKKVYRLLQVGMTTTYSFYDGESPNVIIAATNGLGRDGNFSHSIDGEDSHNVATEMIRATLRSIPDVINLSDITAKKPRQTAKKSEAPESEAPEPEAEDDSEEEAPAEPEA